ncbi:predicted protein [Naegleria gruberi]|uniref:ATP-dependent RNA helicase n=1 Tax=Naegleria gruberi TaxID=5762 RepID=D2VT16_NAEGR|nr:uncharacterized protein NAEGRDRAFT_72139 [Naegleria gruberi]EFC40005.1 predicted protein [Naegleria gruberi]|eukprot:XP_002672749.1 predicted protein [Naegleria gruberi strain NEG-M]
MKKVDSFQDLELREDLLRGVYGYGLKQLSEIQTKCIMPIISSEPPLDVVCISSSGTGKKTAFSIALLQRIDLDHQAYSKGAPQALVITPTREMSQVISNHIKKLAHYLDVKVLPFHGGVSTKETIQALNEIQHVVVGTNKLMDLIRFKVLNLKYLKLIIIDRTGCDWLDMYDQQILRIINASNKFNLQICVFGDSRNIGSIEQYLKDPIYCELE